MKTSEFHRSSDEFGKRPKEIHTTKQRLMHGSEINSNAPGKTAVRKKRRSITDVMKYAVAGIAAAAVTVTAGFSYREPAQEQEIETPPKLGAIMGDFKYQYTISYPTHRETLTPGGYAIYLDISTEEKKQALYKYYADMICGYLQFFDEYNEEYRSDPDPKKFVMTYLWSETENGVLGINSTTGMAINASSSVLLGYSDKTHVVGVNDTHFDDLNAERGRDLFLYSDFMTPASEVFGMENRFGYSNPEDFEKTYRNKTPEEIVDIITEPLDKYFFEVHNEPGGIWTNLRYQVMHTLGQFTITEGKADLIMPEFFSVVRDDDIYGYKILPVSANTDYLLVTGSNEYPSDKPYQDFFEYNGVKFLTGEPERRLRGYPAHYMTYDWAYGTSVLDYPTDVYGHMNCTYAGTYWGMKLTNLIYEQTLNKQSDTEATYTELAGLGSTGQAAVYYDMLTMNVAQDAEVLVPQLSRLLPIEDEYYRFEMTYSDTYTITNNGDHEVAVIGNLELRSNEETVTRETDCKLFRTGELAQYFDYEPLMPGESITIRASTLNAGWGYATLTMPQCCSLVNSRGEEIAASNVKIDVMNGTIKED